MRGSQLELKLIPVSKKLSKKGGYRGHIVGRREMGYDEVIDEAIRTSHLNFDAIAMKLVVESVFHSMISGIMKDGVSRSGEESAGRRDVRSEDARRRGDGQGAASPRTGVLRYLACEVSRVSW